MVDSTALFDMIAMQGWEWLIIHEADRYAKFQPKQKPLMKFIDPNLDSSSTHELMILMTPRVMWD